MGHYTRNVTLHPLPGAAPVTRRCTRSEEVQCPRIRCSTTPNKYLHGYTIASHTVRWAHCHCRQPTQQPASSRHALHPLRGTTPVTSRCTRYGALHPLRRTAPVTGHYTRSEEVQCPRIGCSATPGKYRRGHAIQVSPRKHSRCLRSETPPLRTRLSQASLATHCPLTSESRTRWSASGNISLIRRACATSPCFHSALYR